MTAKASAIGAKELPKSEIVLPAKSSRKSRSASGLFRVSYTPPVSVALHVTLEGASPAGIPVTVEFRRVNARPNLMRTATLDANGNATVTQITPGLYDVAVTGARWLRRVTRVTITESGGSVEVTLPGGDANNLTGKPREMTR